MKYLRILMLIPLLAVFACDSGGGDKSIFINGEILNFGEFGIVEVEVREDDRTRDSADVEDDGSFELNFNADSGSVDLRFIGDGITIIRPNFSVTDDSEIDLDVKMVKDNNLFDSFFKDSPQQNKGNNKSNKHKRSGSNQKRRRN